MTQFSRLEIDRGVAKLVLDRPDKRNALRREFIEELIAATERISADSSVRVMVLKAHGDAFCAGMDLGQMQERAASGAAPSEYQRDSEVYCRLLTQIFELPVPTIAAVQGPALAGGMGLVCACDIVIAVESAFFMLPEPMRGITAAMVTPLLIHRVGAGQAGYMLLSAEKVGAIDARRMGLVHDVVESSELDNRVDQVIKSVLGGAKSAFALTKRHLRDCLSADTAELVRRSIEVSAVARESGEAREGLAAFLEKRKPCWQIH
jgi:methylglutaconyl-CoA hydratase